MNNLLSYYGLIDARISASEKDLPVLPRFVSLIQEYQAGKKPKLQRVKQKTLSKLFSAARRKENHLVVCSTYVLTLVCALCDRDAPR